MKFIENIEIKNFKSIRHQKIEGCKRVNVFIGYPNVGKSNILEALGLFSFLKLGEENFSLYDICRFKNARELFFNQDGKHNIEILVNKGINIELFLSRNAEIDFRINKFVDNQGNPDNFGINKFTVNRDGNMGSYQATPESNYNFIIGNVKKYDFKRDVIVNSQKSLSLSIPFGDNLLDILQSSSSLRKDIVDIFSQYKLKLIIDRTDESIKFQKELEDGSVVSIPYHQVADTLRRLIFYKAAIITNSNSILLFEEPEAHMFPPYISKFANDVVYDENDNQFFIATHSPFVLNDLIDNLKSDELAIYIVSYKKDTGETIINRMNEEDMHEAYQFGYDFFMNIDKFIPQEQHD